MFTVGGGGGGATLIDERVTPISGFFVVDGWLGDPESGLRHTGGGLSGVADGTGGGGGGGAGAELDAPGALGAGWALLGGGLATVDASGVTLAACPPDRDTSSTLDTTIATAASAAAVSVAVAALVRYHGCTTRICRSSMRSGFQVPIGALAGPPAAGTSAGQTSSRALRSRSCSAATAIGSVIGSVIASTGSWPLVSQSSPHGSG